MVVFQRLQDWQDLKRINDSALADMIGCHRSVLSRAKRGIHALKMRHQIAIESLSGIRPSEWAEFYAAVEKRAPTGKSAQKKKRKPP